MFRRPLSPTVRAALLAFALWVCFNANGRESGAGDTQAMKFLVREVVLRHTLTLDATVAATPQFAERAAFFLDDHGHWRSSYGVLPALLAAVPAALAQYTGLIDLNAPLAPNLFAKLTASTVMALGLMLTCLALFRRASVRTALMTTCVLGLGTAFWPTASQALWQHSIAAFGVALALWAWWDRGDPSPRLLAAGVLGIALAGAVRMQMMPLLAIPLVGMTLRVGWRRMAWPLGGLALSALLQIAININWFGSVLGAASRLEALHPVVHNLPDALSRTPWIGAAGLLVSPSRGLLVFSPVVLVALPPLWKALIGRVDRPHQWLAAAIVAQFVLYACYSVWWGGFTYGPRYLMDVLVALAPFGALGLETISAWGRRLAAVAAIWSIGVSALGAFVYPNDEWNSSPESVDQFHERLWDWHDTQIVRAWHAGPSPQNFRLLSLAAVRVPVSDDDR